MMPLTGRLRLPVIMPMPPLPRCHAYHHRVKARCPSSPRLAPLLGFQQHGKIRYPKFPRPNTRSKQGHLFESFLRLMHAAKPGGNTGGAVPCLTPPKAVFGFISRPPPIAAINRRAHPAKTGKTWFPKIKCH